MTRNDIIWLLISFFLFERVFSQTLTVPDPNVPGGSIVEVSTLDANGIPVVSTIESIPPDGVPTPPAVPGVPPTPTSTTSSTTTQPPPVQAPAAPPGPVGAPPQNTVPVGEGTTTFIFTTVVDGATEVLTGTFTPTYNTLPLPPPPTSGTILGLSQFQAQFGTAASGAQSSQRLGLTTSNTVTILTIVCGVAAGALLTM